jgi:hypothetical protein
MALVTFDAAVASLTAGGEIELLRR